MDPVPYRYKLKYDAKARSRPFHAVSALLHAGQQLGFLLFVVAVMSDWSRSPAPSHCQHHDGCSTMTSA
jgi:hypothetical protein